MKLSAVAAIAATAALVSATPLRVVVLSKAGEGSVFPHIRMGHAVHNPNVAQMTAGNGAAPVAHHRPCAATLIRLKTLELANKLRQMFGLPLIEDSHKMTGHRTIHGGMIHIIPLFGASSTFVDVKGQKHGATAWWGHTKGGDRVDIVPGDGGHPHHEHKTEHKHEHKSKGRPHCGHKEHHHQPHHNKHSHHRHNSFSDRVRTAISSLGPWEGRAFAFVVGAGIGVLLRMIWVLSVVAYRRVSGKRTEYAAVAARADDDEEDDEAAGPLPRRTPLSAPPVYVYPIDEKVPVEGVKSATI